MRQVKFKNKKYIVVGGALATKAQYENGRVSYAHIMPDGAIMRFRKKIGSEDELEEAGDIKVSPKITPLELMVNFLSRDEGWPF